MWIEYVFTSNFSRNLLKIMTKTFKRTENVREDSSQGNMSMLFFFLLKGKVNGMVIE